MKMGHSDIFAVLGNFGAENIARCLSCNQLQMKGSSIADVCLWSCALLSTERATSHKLM